MGYANRIKCGKELDWDLSEALREEMDYRELMTTASFNFRQALDDWEAPICDRCDEWIRKYINATGDTDDR